MIVSIASILFYAVSSVFQKMGSTLEEKHSEFKLLLLFGVFSGLAALGIDLLGLREGAMGVWELIKARPYVLLSPLLYLASLNASFVAYKYIPAHLEAPLSNTDGIFSFIGVLILLPFFNPEIFDEEVTPLRIICVFFLLASVFILYCTESEESDIEENIKRAEGHVIGRRGNFAAAGILLGLLGGFLDGSSSLADIIILGGFADTFDYIYISNVISFLIAAVIWLWFSAKEKKPYNFMKKEELPKMLGAGCDCLATVFYMMAVGMSPVFAAPLISINCVLGIVLSRIILKEKIGRRKMRSIILTIAALFLFIAVDEFS